ncbi:hypothetical protein SCRES3_gp58 [Synechococcus phage S-CRES3]|nr:hypothetical protein SCRES3_gp58 [Synechococcus phage S-CRES3]
MIEIRLGALAPDSTEIYFNLYGIGLFRLGFNVRSGERYRFERIPA